MVKWAKMHVFVKGIANSLIYLLRKYQIPELNQEGQSRSLEFVSNQI